MTQTKEHAAFLYRMADALDTGAMPVDPEKLREIAQHLDEMTITMIGLRREIETERALSFRNQVADAQHQLLLKDMKIDCITSALIESDRQRDELLAALEQFAAWGRMQYKAQSKGGHATFDMWNLRDEIELAEAAIASVKGGAT